MRKKYVREEDSVESCAANIQGLSESSWVSDIIWTFLSSDHIQQNTKHLSFLFGESSVQGCSLRINKWHKDSLFSGWGIDLSTFFSLIQKNLNLKLDFGSQLH